MIFYKYQGLGNDFIIIEDLDERLNLPQKKIAALCHRHLGIGADGLILVKPSNSAHFKMTYYNANGSQAEMCGNGIRCFIKFLNDLAYIKEDSLDIETMAGIKKVTLFRNDKVLEEIEVNMGPPVFFPKEIPVDLEGSEVLDYPITIENRELKISTVSMGNPHCIIEVDEFSDDLIQKVGPVMENHSLFPQKTNVEFIKIISPGLIEMRVWERGIGETMACGTGACASAVISIHKGKATSPVQVKLPGGILTINWPGQEDVFLRGPAQKVFKGNIDLTNLE